MILAQWSNDMDLPMDLKTVRIKQEKKKVGKWNLGVWKGFSKHVSDRRFTEEKINEHDCIKT